MDYKELELYGRKVRVYNETHIETEFRLVKDKWRQVKLSKGFDGYYYFNIRGKGTHHILKVHRLVFYAHNQSWDIYDGSKDNIIDHINNEPLDNRIENLRNVSNTQNCWNTLKHKGYTWDNARKKWMCRITHNKKTIHLGRFDNEEEARNAYLTAKEKYHVIEDN
tara:strand:+ start:108 stop:602 length:495 start_codon:yes stop_codon:yes gene_type:complete